MTYDFDTVINRRGTGSLKWDVPENELPMWVADMDFATAPEIRKAIQKRAAHGVFGYSVLPDAWYRAYIDWWQARHNFTIQKGWLLFSTGVIPSLASIVRRLTAPAEKVLVQSPVYNHFYNAIRDNGREVLESPLCYDGTEYTVDFADLEAKLADPKTTLMILCNPHNPIGKIWDRGTLARIGELCLRHHVVIVADEIHCDLTEPGCEYVPFASVSDVCRDNSVTCIAPTKTFNLAGMQTSAVVVPDSELRNRVWAGLCTDEVTSPNAFAVDATVAAFTQGGAWLDELRTYISQNRRRVVEFVQNEIPQLRVVPSQATYLLWLDGTLLQAGAPVAAKKLRKDAGLYLTPGRVYGTGGEDFFRMNVACPKILLEEGLVRLKKGIEFIEHL
jgi:cystathionine beta-lyase